MTLDQLVVGQSAVVDTISGEDEISLRLMEMGLVPETGLRVIGTAPLGDPIELDVRGYRLSLRRAEAQRVQIHPA